MKILALSLTLWFFVIDVQALVPRKLTLDIYKQIKNEMNNVHYFVINSKLLTSDLIKHFDHYDGQKDVKLFQCDPVEGEDIFTVEVLLCSDEVPLYLIMNTIQIDFNGRSDNPNDIKKWIQYRINEHPNRMHSLEELKEYVREKFEVFCFVDREKEVMTKKEYIFVAVAKQIHYLYFCYLDESIGKELSLKEGHLVHIRKNLSTEIDIRSENVDENHTEHLFEAWKDYLMRTFALDFRIESRRNNNETILVECDQSLQCEDVLSILLRTEKVWRHYNEDLNFNLRIYKQTTGVSIKNDSTSYDLPAFRYIKKQFNEESGQQQCVEYLYAEKGLKVTIDSIDQIKKKMNNNELVEDKRYIYSRFKRKYRGNTVNESSRKNPEEPKQMEEL